MKSIFQINAGRTTDIDQLLDELQAAVAINNGAILIDEYDPVILDDVRRVSIPWNRIDKREAPGETTGGFDQTAIGAARSAARRSLGFTGVSPTRTQRTGKTIKAIVADTSFGIFDRSVYQQQGRKFGNLEQKDVKDLAAGCIRRWASLFYTGSVSGDANEFDGLRTLCGAGTDIGASASILKGINSQLVSMTNSADREVMPTAIYTNAMVVWMLNRELLSIGDKLGYAEIKTGNTIFKTPELLTPVGPLPLIADPFNTAIAGTPDVYPTFIISEDKLSWQYVRILGAAGADPKTYEISLTNALDLQYKTLMFGALETLQVGTHMARLNVYYRDTPISPVA